MPASGGGALLSEVVLTWWAGSSARGDGPFLAVQSRQQMCSGYRKHPFKPGTALPEVGVLTKLVTGS